MRPCLSISSEQEVACQLAHMGKASPRQYRETLVTGAVRLHRLQTNRYMDIVGVCGCSHFLRVFMVPLGHCCLSKIKQ